MAAVLVSLLLLAVTGVCPRTLVVVNSAVEVSRGRSVFITRAELQISVDPSADCKVEVVMNEPVTQRVGRLSPQVFDCSFLEDEVKYVHDGSPLLDEDVVMLRVYRFTSSDTQVETVILRVRVVDSGAGVVALGSAPLVVPQFYGLSNAINGSVLNIRAAPDLVCTVRLLTADTSVPAAGRLVREEDSTQRKGTKLIRCRQATLCPGNSPCLHDTTEVHFLKTSCHEFLSSALKYQHLSPPSPEIDYVPVRVELREQASRALLEAVWLPVLIHGAMQNQPPQATFMASFILEVDQFILTPLTTATLDAKDHETPQEKLVFNVTVPPAEGYITHLDDHTKPIRSFTWLDLHEMKVAYQPSNSSRGRRRNYEVEFQVIDGSYLTSPPIVVHVSIRTSETNAPRVSWNVGLDLLEGQSRPITWEQLQIVDSDNIDAVYLVAVDGPLHGRLSVRGGKAFMFRVRDLKEGTVVYHHSDSDSTRDHVVFRISDGRHSVRHKFPINILRRTTLRPSSSTTWRWRGLSPAALCCKPSCPALLVSELFCALPAGSPVASFLQRDLIQGQIFYQHSGDEQFEDAFDFTLSDSHRPPNLSQTYTVVVHVFPVEDQVPVEVPGSVRPAARRLFYTDSTNAMKKDTQRPCNFLWPSCRGRGHWAESLFVQFVFSVSDHHGDTVSGLIFNITVTPVDDQAPEAFTNLLRVEEGGAAFVTEEHLLIRSTARHGRLELWGQALQQGGGFTLVTASLCFRYIHDDSETTEDVVGLKVSDGLNSVDVVLHVQVNLLNKGPPQLGVTVDYLSATDRDSDDSAGELQRAGVTVDKFSSRTSCGEIGPEPVFDTVTLIISDSEARGPDSCCHGRPLLPVNDKVPAVTLGESMLVVDEGSSICLCGGVLGASDPDSPPEQLVFHLETPPFTASWRTRKSFTLKHLTSGFINYVQSEHKGVEPTVDQLSISVSDGLHRSAPVSFYIIIKPTNDETPSLLLANFTVKEGGMRELIPSILDGFDLDAPPELLTFTVVQPPAHGSLINSIHGTEAGADLLHRSLSVTSFTLQELRQGMRIVYMHDDTETLKDAVALRLTDGVHAVEGTVQVTVLLVNDEKPRLNAGLQVDSGELRVISSVVLEAEDLDTPPEQVYYFLNVAPRFGKLQLKTTSGWNELTAGQNFTQGDVEMNRLWYQHTAATNAAGFKGHDSFRFTLSDLDNESPAQSFFISVHVMQKGDIVVLSRPVHLREGQRVVLNTDILLASDSTGRPKELVYTVSDPPRHGLVHAVHRPGVPLLSFTQLDVAAHRVCYTHDNSHDAEADSFSFVVTNGDSSRSSTLHFTIEHGDRIPPTLSRNVGLRLQDGSTVTITSDQLQLTDPDTTTANLGYVITQLPQHGKLLLRGTPLPSPPRFSQTNVDDLHLTYQHDPSSPAKIDGSTLCRATDTTGVDWVDRTPPTLTTRGSPSTVVDLGGGRYGIFITSRELQASDPDSPTEELEFSISRPPLLGYLENAATGSYIKGRFTQRDVDRRAVMFVLPADVEVTSDSFLFVLRDPAGNTSSFSCRLELSWSRVELSATCYRTCETAGILQIRVQRNGRSADPAYVAIQVDEGSAKAGRDFTHSTASLIQFDPGVKVKTWNIYLIDDGLEENHESFTVTLRNPQNAVLGPRSSATVEIIDPHRGDMIDLINESNE
uniref:Fras1 related extracellular matrix 1b n=1 Tax=Maylandia zebra TaxID=106582 RepID=A0A3P9DC75_9CICH